MKRLSFYLITAVLLGTLLIRCSKAGQSIATNNVNASESKLEETSDNSENIIPEDKIFATISGENMWVFDPTVPKNFINSASSVVKIKVLSTDKAKFLDSLNNPSPYTPVNVEVINTLSGETLSGKMTIYYSGGSVLISDVIKSTKKDSVEKMGLTKLNEKDKNSKYINYTSESNYKLEVGKKYIVTLNKQTDGSYTITGEGYGIFKSKNENSTKTDDKDEDYSNVLTGNSFK
ncbi:MAG: hypothetical protein AB6733_14260 [Clostridiaceae bacterium]